MKNKSIRRAAQQKGAAFFNFLHFYNFTNSSENFYISNDVQEVKNDAGEDAHAPQRKSLLSL